MGYQIPINAPLTEAQSELTSKIGSMRSLLTLSQSKRLSIPKTRQISTFDYLKKIIETLGFTLEPLFLAFTEKVFDQAGTFLEEKVIDSFSKTLAQRGIGLPNTTVALSQINDKMVFDLQSANSRYIKSLVPANFLSVAKQQMAKDLMIMMVGPKNAPSTEYLNPDVSRREVLINEAICSSFAFSMSNQPVVREEDLEYNRIKLAKQLEKGEVEFFINCQNVSISLPDNPSIFFEGGGIFSQTSTVVTPAQSIQFFIEYVGNQVQTINNEKNAQSGARSFFELLIENLLGSIAVIIGPYFSPLIQAVNSTNVGQNLQQEDFFQGNCYVLNNPSNLQARQFAENLSNQLFKQLLSLMLIFVIREFKKLVKNYLAKISIERQKRKLEKIKQKFSRLNDITDKTEKAIKYKQSLESLSDILGNQDFFL